MGLFNSGTGRAWAQDNDVKFKKEINKSFGREDTRKAGNYEKWAYGMNSDDTQTNWDKIHWNTKTQTENNITKLKGKHINCI